MRTAHAAISLLASGALLCAGITSAQGAPAAKHLIGEFVVAEASDGAQYAAVATDAGFVPVADDTAGLEPGQQVRAQVEAAPGGRVATELVALPSTQAAAPQKVTAKARKHTVTIVTATQKGTPGKPVSVAAAKKAVKAADRYWRAQGKGVSFKIVKTKANVHLKSSCADPWKLWDEAAKKAKFKPGDGKHLVVFLPRAANPSKGCSYGLGSVGSGVASGGYSYQVSGAWGTTAHELGHNLSFQHAQGFEDKTGEARKGKNVVEYGDYYSVMGYGHGNISARDLLRVGLIAKKNIREYSKTKTVTLRALDAKAGLGSKLKTVKVTDPNTGLDYWLEYRPNLGWDRTSAFHTTAGVLVRTDNPKKTNASVLVDTRKRSGRSTDAALTRGRSWTSAGNGVKVSVISTGSKSAKVKIVVKRAKNVPAVKFTAAKSGTFHTATTLKVTTDKKIDGKVKFVAEFDDDQRVTIKTVAVKKGKATFSWSPSDKFAGYGKYVTLTATLTPKSKKLKKVTAKRAFTLTARTPKIAATDTGTSLDVRVTGGTRKPTGWVEYTATPTTGAKKTSQALLSSGRASIRTSDWAAGVWKVKVTYQGDSPGAHLRTWKPTSTTFTVTIIKRETVTVAAEELDSTTDGHKRIRFTYTAKSGSRVPTGTVKVALPSDGGWRTEAELKNGSVIFELPYDRSDPRWVVDYSGDQYFDGSRLWFAF